MIRFIDLRNQGISAQFAFWDTIMDRFCEFAGQQAWDNKAQFFDSVELNGKLHDVRRFTRLMPDWVPDKCI